MKTDIHIWPKSKFNFYNIISSNFYTSEYVEKKIKRKFNNKGYPLLVSSGRVGITLILLSLALKRNDKVKIFPYASKCVRDAVSNVCIPSNTKVNNKSSVQIIYHQYGYINSNVYKGILIEDAVDTLVQKNGKIFLSGGKYEIWSLNKILGSFGGAIIWCKNILEYKKIKKIRDSRNRLTHLTWFLKLLSAKYPFFSPLWFKIETIGGPIPNWALKQIFIDIKKWDNIAKERLKRFKILRQYIPKWIKFSNNRIPCAVPVLVNKKNINSIKNLGMQYGERHFLLNNNKLIKLFLISTHQDVSIKTLNKIKDILKK